MKNRMDLTKPMSLLAKVAQNIDEENETKYGIFVRYLCEIFSFIIVSSRNFKPRFLLNYE